MRLPAIVVPVLRVQGAATQLHAAALAALTAGHLPEARRLVERGLQGAVDPLTRAELVRLRARLSTWSGPISPQAWLEVVQVAEQVADAAPELAAALLCDAAVLAAYTRQLAQAERLAQRALELTGGQGLVGAVAATGLGTTYALTGRLDEAVPLLARTDELLDADTGIVESAELLMHTVLALMAQERYDEAVESAVRFLTAARSLHAVGLLPLPLCLLAHAAWKAGRWNEGRMAASEALTLAASTGETSLELYANAMLSLVAGGQGRERVCAERVARATELAEATGVGMFRVTVQAAQVHLVLGLGRPQDALAPLAEIGALMGEQRRAGMLNWYADHVDALVLLGRLDEVEPVLRRLEHDAATNRWEAAALLRCRGQVEPDDARAVELLRASVQAFEGRQPYEQARSRLRLAQRLGYGVEAREQAAEAQAAFRRLGAAGWAEQAAALLDGAPAPAQRNRRASDRALELAAAPPTAVACALEVRLLGGFAVLRDGKPVALASGAPSQAVKYVAVRGGRASADDLVEALWPGAEPGRGRTRLRNVLTRLRRDAELLVRDGDHVSLPEGAVCDATLFLEEAEQALAGDLALARRAVDRYAGELLPGDRYQDWTARARERVRARYLQLLDRLADDAAARDEVDQALAWWERAVDVERYDEDRYVAMAALLVAHGRIGPANRVVRRALEMLDRLGVVPSARLSALATQVGA